MDRLIERVAGLDVHKASVKAGARVPAERAGERHSQTRTFRTATAGLVLLGGWLASHQVTVGAGVDRGGLEAGLLPAGGRVPVLAAEARHLRNVPGRNTDVADAAWICQLVEHGLVRPSFVPPSRSASCAT